MNNPAKSPHEIRGPRDFSRRAFLRLTGSGLAVATLHGLPLGAAVDSGDWDPDRPLLRLGEPLTVQPVLMYRIPVPRREASWKSWGGVQTETEVAAEIQRIEAELSALQKEAAFPLKIHPVAGVSRVDEARRAASGEAQVTLVYACTGGGDLLRACLSGGKDNLIFVRHRSGPIYYWYEALSTLYLETNATPAQPSAAASPKDAHVDDVVVDDYTELGWRLRALFGVHSLRGTRVVALGGPWGKYSPAAPQVARDQFTLDLVEVTYEAFEPRLKQALEDRDRVALAARRAERYLGLPGTTLRTDRDFVVRAFVLYDLFKELMTEHRATVFTIKSCMGTIIPMSKTTACLALSLLNDEGQMAFCESDFVIIPAGILLRYLCGRPVFLHNSTFPHAGVVTCAHCTAPRRMDGAHYCPATILTHYESEYGAAPKVEIPLGQVVTFLDPEYSAGRWLGFTGTVRDNPFYAICRSQQDVEIHGQWRKLISEVRDSHWVMACGDYTREAGYAARKLGIAWVTL